MLPSAFLILALSMGLMVLDIPVAGMGLLLTTYFLGFNLLEAGMPSLLARVSGTRGRGRRMGVYSTFQFLGAFAGGVIGGALLTSLGSAAALFAAAGACLVWAVVLNSVSKRFFLTRAQA